LEFRASKAVAGLEPEQTNIVLQHFADAVVNTELNIDEIVRLTHEGIRLIILL